MTIHFQDEIIMDILSRLSVRSILRFRCVSKLWKTLISEPYFTMKHQSYAMNSKKLLVGQCWYDDTNKFHSTSLYCSPLSSAQLIEDVEELVCPRNHEPPRYKEVIIKKVFKVCCSCNGLVLLLIDEHLLLWNPSTRESIELPYSKTKKGLPTFGLGYDTTNDDYKVLKFHRGYMEILTLKSDCWRNISLYNRIDSLPMYRVNHDPFAFIHGAFHWVGFHNKHCVVSLSISNEVCGKIQLLEPMRKMFDDQICKYGVVVFREMLCFYCAHILFEETSCKLWVMKEYGIEESWIQFYTIQEMDMTLNRPLHMFDDGEVLLLSYENHPLRTSKGPFGLGCISSGAIQQAITYSESAISPKLLI